MGVSRSQPCGADKEPLPPTSELSGAYRADGLRVIKNPVRTTKPDGSRAVALGFTVCTVGEIVGAEGAAEIVRVLNSYDGLLAAAREMSAVLSRCGDWDDGCFYYNGTSATELEGPQQRLADAIEATGQSTTPKGA